MTEEQKHENKQVQYLPFDVSPDDKKPITTDTELAKDLMKVVSRTAADKIIVKEFDEDGNFLGYKIKDAPNIFYEIINEDMTKSNLDPRDLAVVRGLCTMSNYTQAISKQLNVDLSASQKFLADTLVSFLNSSRGKGGWNAWLSKTDKTISQTTMEQIAQQIGETKKRWWKFW
ncbi:hypothetical protein DRN67_02855 [Candidatus Micrarchaeota archaeon]|nr:MAG: hypothetical protein DRN67_02855 [Candidatus Micrarchaeota archaeon]